MFVDCILSRGSLYEKGFGIRSVSKLTLGFQTLFQFASQTRTAMPSGLPLGGLVRFVTPFCCGKTSGERAAARDRERRIRRCGGYTSSSYRSVFPQEKRRSPAGDTTQAIGRPVTQSVIASAKRTEKESENQRIELNRIPEIHSLFHIACRNKPTKKLPFEVSSRGGFGLQSRPLDRLPLTDPRDTSWAASRRSDSE